MPKKRRSEGKDKIVPHNVTEHFRWKCTRKGCKVEGRAYTKKDAKYALAFHTAIAHGGK
jgi:hypothetical protein